MVWKTLYHNGLYFPYKYVFQNIKVIYNSKEYLINPKLEEALFLFIKSKCKTDKLFSINFLNSIYKYLPNDLKKINSIHELNLKFFINKNIILKSTKTKNDKYKFCIINGKKEELSKYVPEPAYIFIGRGNHPLRGTFKELIQPKDVIVNISKNATIDNKNQYKQIIHNKSVNWIASWKDIISGKNKYIYPSSHSDIQTICSLKKFNFARSLSKKIKLIRNTYNNHH